MTRKDYVLIAAAQMYTRGLYGAPGTTHVSVAIVDECSRRLAWHLADDNPRFDRARFLTACGVVPA